MSTKTRYLFGNRPSDYLDCGSYTRDQMGMWGSNPAIVAAVRDGSKTLWEVPPHEPTWLRPRAAMVSDCLPSSEASVIDREAPPARRLSPAEALAVLGGD